MSDNLVHRWISANSREIKQKKEIDTRRSRRRSDEEYPMTESWCRTERDLSQWYHFRCSRNRSNTWTRKTVEKPIHVKKKSDSIYNVSFLLILLLLIAPYGRFTREGKLEYEMRMRTSGVNELAPTFFRLVANCYTGADWRVHIIRTTGAGVFIDQRLSDKCETDTRILSSLEWKLEKWTEMKRITVFSRMVTVEYLSLNINHLKTEQTTTKTKSVIKR